jgi:hypothetical protein
MGFDQQRFWQQFEKKHFATDTSLTYILPMDRYFGRRHFERHIFGQQTICQHTFVLQTLGHQTFGQKGFENRHLGKNLRRNILPTDTSLTNILPMAYRLTDT